MDINELSVGQPVMIRQGYGKAVTLAGTVIKVGRVWIDVQIDDRPHQVERYRADTQNVGGQWAQSNRFYTLDQWADVEREEAANEFLRKQGIVPNFESPWYRRRVELADIIKAAISVE